MKEIQDIALAAQAKKEIRNRKNDTTGASMKGENAPIVQGDESRKVVAGVKRKAQSSLYELEGEEQKAAMKMMKSSLEQPIRRHNKKPLVPTVKSVSDRLRFMKSLD